MIICGEWSRANRQCTFAKQFWNQFSFSIRTIWITSNDCNEFQTATTKYLYINLNKSPKIKSVKSRKKSRLSLYYSSYVKNFCCIDCKMSSVKVTKKVFRKIRSFYAVHCCRCYILDKNGKNYGNFQIEMSSNFFTVLLFGTDSFEWNYGNESNETAFRC